jgi:hypothetical protein
VQGDFYFCMSWFGLFFINFIFFSNWLTNHSSTRCNVCKVFGYFFFNACFTIRYECNITWLVIMLMEDFFMTISMRLFPQVDEMK